MMKKLFLFLAVIGSLSRFWSRPEKPFIALLFLAPRNVRAFSLYPARPLLGPFPVPEI
jgi:hypothetical protein